MYELVKNNYMKKITYILLISLLVIACKDEISYIQGSYFSLSETSVDFDSKAGEYSVEAENFNGSLSASVVSENSGWCNVSVANNKILIQVEENTLVKSRITIVEVADGNEKIKLIVRQNRKYFTSIPAVKNFEANPGPNKVILSWTVPEEDNFSHVILTYNKKGQDYRVVLERGVTEYSVTGLLNSDGEYTFNLQSVDKDNDLGEVVSSKMTAGKLVAFRFESDAPCQWLPYYLRESDKFITTLRVGSAEFNEDQVVNVGMAVDESLLDKYNQLNGTAYQLLPSNCYILPENFIHNGTSDYQDYKIELYIPAIGDRKVYALPLKIESTSSEEINEEMSSTVVIVYVDDLEGWYTVDRLSKNGEGAGKYPADPQSRRRYIKRTGDTTWETGYVFAAYSISETKTGSERVADIQFMSIDPATKNIFIQQGNYAVSTSLNLFDLNSNELNIEYLYRDWAGWWNHEKMHSRSLKR